MLVSCPKCAAQYQVPEDKLKPEGVSIRCKQCENIFTVKPPTPDVNDHSSTQEDNPLASETSETSAEVNFSDWGFDELSTGTSETNTPLPEMEDNQSLNQLFTEDEPEQRAAASVTTQPPSEQPSTQAPTTKPFMPPAAGKMNTPPTRKPVANRPSAAEKIRQKPEISAAQEEEKAALRALAIKHRKQKIQRSVRQFLLLCLLSLIGLVVATVFIPEHVRKISFLDQHVLRLHQTFQTNYYHSKVLQDRYLEASSAIEQWTPKTVLTGFTQLQEVLKAPQVTPEMYTLAGRALFFLALAQQKSYPPLETTVKDPVLSAYLWAIGLQKDQPSDRSLPDAQLAVLWQTFQTDDRQQQERLIALELNQPMPLNLLEALTKAKLYQILNQPTNSTTQLEKATQLMPNNPWVKLLYAQQLTASTNTNMVIKLITELIPQATQLTPEEQLQASILGVRAAIATTNWQQAETFLKLGLDALPNNPEILVLKAVIAVHNKSWGEAKIALDKARSQNFLSTEMIVTEANMLTGAGRVEEALSLFADSLTRLPNQPLLYEHYLDLLIKQNRLEQAQATYQEALSLFNNNTAILLLGVDLALAQHDTQAAKTRIKLIQTTANDSVSLGLKLSAASLQLGEYANAITQLKNLENAGHTDASIQIQLAEAYLATADAKTAEGILLKLIEQNTEQSQAYVLLAKTYLAQGLANQALEPLGQALRLEPGLWSAYVLRAQTHLRLADTNAALLDANRAIELSQGAIEAHLILASIYEQSDLPGKALNVYQEILLKDPKNLLALQRVAEGELLVNNWSNALNVLTTWRTLVPNNPLPLLYMGQVYNGQSQFEQAIESLTVGIKLDPNSPELCHELGWAYLQAQKTTLAKTYIDRAYQFAPKDPLVLLRRGYLYKELNQPAIAKTAFEDAIAAGLSKENKLRAKQELANLSY